jgi:hypothetical protein
LLAAMALMLLMCAGCKQGGEAAHRRESQREVGVTSQVAQPKVVAQPKPATRPAGKPAAAVATRTVECWDGTRVEIPAWANFIGNKSSGKFHRLTCEYVPSKANHLYFRTREEAIAAGQVPCKVCSP